ncbi:MAG TPA: DCC1-like thiol-disulfide oxidoreductase family protein [Crinalium sp.]
MQIRQNSRQKIDTILLWLTASAALICALAVLISYFFLPAEFNHLGIVSNLGHQSRLTLSRIFFWLLIASLGIVANQQRERLQGVITQFFSAVAHPLNLAIFRIVFFWTLCQWIDVGSTVKLSRLPVELRVPTFGLDWLIPILPINESLVKASLYVLFFASFAAMMGLFTRVSAWITAIVGLYALGIPQFYGNVGHFHHLVWISALLGLSRCGDYLSIDAIFAAWKRADRGVVEPPAPANAYALPLHVVWLIIGSVYFFPGVRKFWVSGFDWAFTENFRYHLYRKWLELDWVAVPRIDHAPVLYMPMALVTIIFEAGFFFLIFFPRLRPWIAVTGFSFHSAVKYFMGISFWTLQACYASFVNWRGLFVWIGNRLFPKEMYVVYDGNCKLCRRTIATLRSFDLLDRITYVNALDDEALAAHNLTWLDANATLADMHAVVDRDAWKGFAAYRALSYRMPIFWLFLPLLYVPPIPTIGNAIYRKVADSRTCSLPQPPSQDAGKEMPVWRSRPLVMACAFLIAINIPFGLAGIKSAWPFVCYPTFEAILGPQRETLDIVPLTATGEEVSLNKALKDKIPGNSYRGLVRHILTDNEDAVEVDGNLSQTEQRLQALWKVVARDNEGVDQVATVQFYRMTLWSPPEKWNENPAKRDLLFELKV